MLHSYCNILNVRSSCSTLFLHNVKEHAFFTLASWVALQERDGTQSSTSLQNRYQGRSRNRSKRAVLSSNVGSWARFLDLGMICRTAFGFQASSASRPLSASFRTQEQYWQQVAARTRMCVGEWREPVLGTRASEAFWLMTCAGPLLLKPTEESCKMPTREKPRVVHQSERRIQEKTNQNAAFWKSDIFLYCRVLT